VRALIGEIAREKTIVISTHILEEVDAVCTRAVIIARGRLVADGTPAALKSQAPSGRLEDVFRAVAA
jgi:ABC-2 type transport system ATP-binding protein